MNDGHYDSDHHENASAWVDPEFQYVHDLVERNLTDAEFKAWSEVNWEEHKIIVAIGAIRRILRLYESYLFHSTYFIGRVPGDEELFLRLRHGLVANMQHCNMPDQLVLEIVHDLPEFLPPTSELVLYDEEIRTRTLDDLRSIESRLLQHALESNTFIEIGLADPFFLTHDDHIEALTEAYSQHVDPLERNFRKRYLPTPKDQLNRQVENIELALRRLINSRLDNNLGIVPTNITKKMRERLDKDSSISRSKKLAKMSTLSALLEYADFRELQDIVVNRSTWAQFEDILEDKNTTGRKFDQLANLRNAIRHSRPLNEITQLEGEAAISWFTTILNRDEAPT